MEAYVVEMTQVYVQLTQHHLADSFVSFELPLLH